MKALRAVGVMTAIAITAMSFASAKAAEVTLRVADTFPGGHFITENLTKVWMKRVEELSGGEIGFQYFTAGQLGKIPEMLDLVQNKVVDVAYVPPSSYADRIPLLGVAELPGFFTTAAVGTPAFMSLLGTDLADKQFASYSVKPLFGAVLPQYQVAVAGDPIDAIEDFKDVRVRTPGGVLELAAHDLGGLAVPMGGPEMYTAFQRGTVDATLNAYGSMQSYKLNEVLKSVSTNGSFGSFAMIYVIDQDKLASLSEKHRKALAQAGREAAASFANWVDGNEKNVADKFKGQGIKTYEIPGPVLTEWNNRLFGVAQNWGKRLDQRGQAGSDAVKLWQEKVKAASK